MGRQFWEDREDGSLRQVDRALRVNAAAQTAIGAARGNGQKIAVQLDNEGLLMRPACRNVGGFAVRELESVIHADRKVGHSVVPG